MSIELISTAQPLIGEAEKQAVLEVLDSGVVAQGPVVRRFEEAFADYCGTKYAVALNSGTAAIHCALHAQEIGPGDSVITSPFSFIATANTILMQGASVKFADIQPRSFNIDPQQLEAAYDSSVKAVMPVDLYGQPCDYGQIWDFAQRRDLAVIEDACQAVGATYHDQRAGTLGRTACFSLYATKNIMSAEGGVLTTDDEAVTADAISFRQHGMSGNYEYAQLGYNYRMTDILAAIALSQLARADQLNRIRVANAAKLTEGLAGIPGLALPIIDSDRTSVFHQYTVRVTEEFSLHRDELVAGLKGKGIMAGVYYPKPLHLYSHIARLGFAPGDFPEAEKAAKQVVSLPVHPGLHEAQIQRVISTVRELAGV